MTTFQVDRSSLEALALQLAAIESQMSSIGDVSAQVSPFDLGSAQVFLALQEFHGNWSQGLSTISGNVSGVTNLLLAAAKAYGATDASVQGSAGGSAS
jgi:hypothetical protein